MNMKRLQGKEMKKNFFSKFSKKQKIWMGGLISLVLAVAIGTFVYIDNNYYVNIQLNTKNITVIADESYTVKETKVSKNGTKVQWDVKDKKIATVDKNGKVTGVKKGKTVLTATVKKTSIECPIEVVDLQFALKEDSAQMVVGETKAIEIETNSKNKVAFTSENEEFATVDKDGKITALASGEVKIKASLNKEEKFYTVTIKNEDGTVAVAVDEQGNTVVAGTSGTSVSQSVGKASISQGTITNVIPNTNSGTANNSGSSSGNSSGNNSGGSSSNSGSNSSSNSNNGNGGSSASNNGGSTPAPTPKPEPAPTPVKYTYSGAAAKQYILSIGGQILSDGNAYVGDPTFEQVGQESFELFFAKVQDVHTPECDYILTIDAGGLTDSTPYYRQIANAITGCADKLTQSYTAYNVSFTDNGRKFTVTTTKYGIKISVSPKAS